MIDLVQYRITIGTFLGNGGVCGRVALNKNFRDFSAFNVYNMPTSIKSYNFDKNTGFLSESVIHCPSSYLFTPLFTTLYIYFILILVSVMSLMVLTPNFSIALSPIHGTFYLNWKLSFSSWVYIKIGYFCILASVLFKSLSNSKRGFSYLYDVKHIFKTRSNRFLRLLCQLLLFILLLNFLLIGIINPSLLNPGPNSVKICFQNVQGLVPFKDLKCKQPSLDMKKVLELNTYLLENRPDIMMLNETWLKPCIENNQVINNNLNYTIYRTDRSESSHPSDPDNAKKYRRHGGGVLIAIRSDIKAEFKLLRVRKGAEIKAIEVTINDKTFVFCTVYRVGNLGEQNHDSIMNTIKSFYRIRNPKKIFILGDINLSSVTWPLSEDNDVASGIDKTFTDSFDELGLDQLITEPTHKLGNTLDLLLTNSKNFVSSFKVTSEKCICKSDHFLIECELKANVTYVKPPKRKILNFKKANWGALNSDLNSIEWHGLLDCVEPELAWLAFKKILLALSKRHIPVITVKSNFTLPWFDSDCFEAYRDKERAHKTLKKPTDDEGVKLQREIKFKHKRSVFKQVCNQKMRDNLYNSDDPALITKKFLSHVKSSSKSGRLPETMRYKGKYRNKPIDKAELFNSYFFDQFSCPSQYIIDIDWTNDKLFDIDFSQSKILQLLRNIKTNNVIL